jgi:hypothetical protein
MVTVPDSEVFATEVAVTVTVCAALVAAGVVKVAEVVVVFERVPPPLTVQVTPSELLSLVTTAVSVTVSAPSTVVTDAVTATLGVAWPPQPDTPRATTQEIPMRTRDFRNIEHPRVEVFNGDVSILPNHHDCQSGLGAHSCTFLHDKTFIFN